MQLGSLDHIWLSRRYRRPINIDTEESPDTLFTGLLTLATRQTETVLAPAQKTIIGQELSAANAITIPSSQIFGRTHLLYLRLLHRCPL